MQPITPLEIRQKSFERSFRGYNKEEVDAFLYSLAYAWEKLAAQLDEVKAKLNDSKAEVNRLQAIEHALLQTVNDAEITAKNLIGQAAKEVDLKLKEADLEAAQILNEAQKKAKIVKKDSEQYDLQLKKQRESSFEKIKATMQEAEAYRGILLQKLRHLAEDILAQSQLLASNNEANSSGGEFAAKSFETAPKPTATEPFTTKHL